MSKLGLSLNASTRGFQQGHDWQERTMNRKADRAYRDEQRETYDPIDLETAMLRLKEARRTGELAEYTQQYKKNAADRIDSAGDRTEKRDKTSLPGDLAEIGYRDRRNANADKLEGFSMPGRIKQIGQNDRAAENADELGQAQHPINMKQTDFSGRMLDDGIEDYDEDQGNFEVQEQINNALGNFEMTGNPQTLMDAYSLINDGIDAEITILPEKNPQGGNQYKVSVNNGQPDKIFESKEELLHVTKQVFQRQMSAQQPVRSYGIDPNTMDGKGPADVQTTEYLIQAMQGIEKYAHLSPEELRMAAFSMQKEKASDSPETRLANFFLETFKAQMKPGPYGRAPDPKDAFATAQEMTKLYGQRMAGQGPAKAGDDSEDPKADVNDFVTSMVGRK
jgi:hypothetical protein